MAAHKPPFLIWCCWVWREC